MPIPVLGAIVQPSLLYQVCAGSLEDQSNLLEHPSYLLIETSTANHGSGNDPRHFYAGRVPITTHVPAETTRFRLLTGLCETCMLILTKYRSCRMSRQRTGHLLPKHQGSHRRAWVFPHQGVFQHQPCRAPQPRLCSIQCQRSAV